MNYIQILHETFRICRTSKLVWVFAFILLLARITQPFEQFVRGNIFLVCIFLLASLVTIYVSLIAVSGLVYLIHQTNLNISLTFAEAWSQGRAKLSRNIGLFFLISPALLVFGGLYLIVVFNAPNSLFLWLLVLIFTTFIGSLYTFGICAIMIDDVKVVGAAWTSLLITLNNYFRVLIITGVLTIIYLLVIGLIIAILTSGLFSFELSIPLAFDYSAYVKIMSTPLIATAGWIINLLLTPVAFTILTLCYLKFTKDIHYPALLKE